MILALHQEAPAILLFGQDKALVNTRRWVLEKSGFRVCTAMSLDELGRMADKEEIKMFLLCDSLGPEMRASALTLLQFGWPDARRLVLLPYNSPTEFEPAEEVFMALQGPEKLVATIRTLMVSTPLPVSVSRVSPA